MLKKYNLKTLKTLFLLCLAVFTNQLSAQFYNGTSSMTFGKNRVQTEDYYWEYQKYDSYKIYHYEGGDKLALFAADIVDKTIKNLTQRVDYYLDDRERFNIMIYNKIEEFRKSNIGLNEAEDNLGGVTRIYGRNVFVYFNGDHYTFEQNIKQGISRVLAQQMIFGGSWMEVVKNSALLTVPDWYLDGLVSYLSTPYSGVENNIKDGIQFKKYYKFNRITKSEATYYGHAMWAYIADVYGEKLIKNVLYMSRVSRSIESGFTYVLGVPLKTLQKDMLAYYERNYNKSKINLPELPKKKDNTFIKTKKNKEYYQVKLDEDGKKIAYVENNLGKIKVFIKDLESGKRKKVFKKGYKLQRVTNTDYPLLGWHPVEEMLSIIYEDHDELKLRYYFLETKKNEEKPIFKLQKIKSFDYSQDGKTMIVSGVANGQSDIYLYKVGPNTQKQLTNDIYDDLNPVFIEKNKILFSSNRKDDTLRAAKKYIEKRDFSTSFDLFTFDILNTKKPLKQVTTTKFYNETQPNTYDLNRFSYISDKNGFKQKFIAKQDSAISSIDTTIHYRFFMKSEPISDYKKDVFSYSFSKVGGVGADVVFNDGKYNFYVFNKTDSLTKSTNSKEVFTPASGNSKNLNPTQTVNYTLSEEPASKESFNPKTYSFYTEQNKNEIPKQLPISTNVIDTSTTEPSIRKKIIPSTRSYKLNFIASDITSKFDFNFANQLYQFYNGGPYVPPGMGLVLKVDMIDLFEDYKIEGGVRYSLNGGAREFFASLDNRSGRWDKKYSFQRLVTQSDGDFFSTKTITNLLKARYAYPFNEVSSIRLTPMLRRDKGIVLSTDVATASAEDVFDNWLGLKAEFVFDNSLHKDLNLYTGWKFKVFGEHYRIIDETETDFSVVGFDARYAQKLHRNLIWFNRFSGGTSFGARKLVHYLGAVENWARFTANPTFDFETPISQTAGYYYQTIVPPLRGFIQNARNGNSFAVINSEVRFPIVKYFFSNPIKSEFLANFQIIAFGDIGTAWTGVQPYSNENVFNTKTVTDGNITVLIKNQVDPIAAGIGWGLRSKLFGYFVKLDYAWGIEDGVFQKPIPYLSIGTDF